MMKNPTSEKETKKNTVNIVQPDESQSLLSLPVGDRVRNYSLHIPESYDGNAAMPVVFVLHGAGGRGSDIAAQTGWATKAEEGFLAVFPEGSRRDPNNPPRFMSNPQIWNDGSGRGFVGRANVDDLSFIDKLLDTLSDQFLIDAERVFVTGFSNGASMALRLGVELSHRIAAIGAVAGYFWLERRALEDPVSLLYMVGTEDPLSPQEGGQIVLPWGGTDERPPVRDVVRIWAEMLDCPPEARTVEEEPGQKVLTYGPGRSDSEVIYSILEGWGHVWPGGKGLRSNQSEGRPKNDICATDLMWTFFQRHPKR